MRAAVILIALVSGPALADRGALSADLGAGFEGMTVPAPYVQGAKSTSGAVPALTLGTRYALRNWLEVSLSGFFAFPITYWHNGGTVTTPYGELPGSLSHELLSYGGAVGARLVHGEEVRLVVGCELGWVHRAYSQFAVWNDANPSNVAPYPLSPPLASVGVDSAVLAPLAGVEWAAGDHYSLSFLPRLQILMGSEKTIGVLLPITFSWNWFI